MMDRSHLSFGFLPGAQAPSYRRVLRTPSLGLLWASQLVSQSGDYVFDVALIWYVAQRSALSPLDIASVSIAAFVPWIVLSPLIGTLIDESNRRTALLVSNLVQAAVVGLLAYLVLVRAFALGPILVLVMVLNSGGVAVGVSARSMLAHIVAKEDLSAANGIFFFSNSANQLLGFSLGGVVVALAGSALPIEYDALTFVVAAALVISIAPKAGEVPPLPGGREPGPWWKRFWPDLKAGASYVHGHQTLRRMLLMVTFSTFVLNGYTVLSVLYVYDVVGSHSALSYGAFLASMAAGGTLGSILIGRIDARAHVGTALFLGTGGLGAITALLGVAHFLALGLLLAFLLNASGALVTVSSSSWIQAQVPEALQARVWGYTGLTRAGAPAGAALVGGLASGGYTVPAIMLGVGLGVLALVGVLHVAFRDLRSVSY
ncbi:MAG: MFS transporter [Euryarchaeota archaeon]|nr:MFS transporter [Euryarchaeota archaeon]MDE1837091.1 MFS transporter [Euryarchaeota archaeon]MDE1879697.1 MFS transporter [Euryarchaeota archaeon]MDE2045223.1 MFS transporter [Thermoplasmata archaeon]